MKYFAEVVHLSTGHAGGAGLAARRLNESLNESGANSKFFALKQKGYIPVAHEFEIGRSLPKKIEGALNTRIQNGINDRVAVSLSSAGAINLNQLLSEFDSRSSIIHVHNWFNLLSFDDLKYLASSSFKLVFTLHDERIFTGGCHYAFDCRGFEKDCKGCPLVGKLFKNKVHQNVIRFLDIFNLNQNISFITPSEWLSGEAKKSSVLSKFDIGTLQNVLGPTFLRQVIISPKVYNKSRRLRVGVASGDPKSFTKGGDLVDLVNDSKLIEMFFMKDFRESDHGNFWNNIDILFVPSRADNSPNVILEANAYGVPIVASQVGGISENLSLEYDRLFHFQNIEIADLMKLFIQAAQTKAQKVAVTPLQQQSRGKEIIAQYVAFYEKLIRVS